jgi:NAD(P)-dependent dehydrogenase (short-subunit alcohol dehydrogenase family)
MRPTTFAGKSVLVTGANRGLGQALVDEALSRGAQRSTSERDSRSHMRTGALCP